MAGNKVAPSSDKTVLNRRWGFFLDVRRARGVGC
jgi:hypothetical protein